MPATGAHKDIRKYVADLEAKGYFIERKGSGHFSIFPPGATEDTTGIKAIASISQTPRNPHRAILNAEGHVRRWERSNLMEEKEEMPAGSWNRRGEHRVRSHTEKSRIITLFDACETVAE